MFEFSRRAALGAICAVAASIASVGAHAEGGAYPTKPVKLVVGFPPGGSTDVVARILADSMTTALGQPVVVENRDGASGAVGVAYVASSDADGYTVGLSGIGTSILAAALGKDPGYSIDDDLEIIGVTGTLGMVIGGHKGLEPKTLPELIAYAKSHPGEVTYGTSGVGTPGHLAMEYLAHAESIDMLHIPYKGNTPMMNDLLGGHVDVAMMTIPGAVEQIRAGGIQPYAVTSPKRSDLMPEMPTASEAALDGFSATLWNLLVAPAGTDPEVQEVLSNALNAAMNDLKVLKAFKMQGLAPMETTPEEAAAFLNSERDKWVGVIESVGVETK
ncbi:Bug family tripartite tricarboxylate transporter substrate binding protein [Paracoccus saliphilus]|uniref:Tripartite tricarboxylate transporter substrate binding protein n=1 Tax=Paracoccus saliphilus TaxID=405559 RepID=A0AA45W647_9RHOB|nr:tripartite tricarboxylate transporter substrate binding protein [Paracoccus saliphilus]WCR01534.1 tripartite tricarboxylate transporter substrate binding protein [Paracoccus saliphilus]SIS99168.1 Tripartite-type tricarboxylate transporter, receptor component TctC [Paracoccus saliphilus]